MIVLKLTMMVVMMITVMVLIAIKALIVLSVTMTMLSGDNDDAHSFFFFIANAHIISDFTLLTTVSFR